MPLSRESLGMLLGFGRALMFAGTLPASRLAVASLDPLFITFARAALPGIISAVLLVILRRRIPPRERWGAITIASLTLVYGFPLFAATILAGERPGLGSDRPARLHARGVAFMAS